MRSVHFNNPVVLAADNQQALLDGTVVGRNKKYALGSITAFYQLQKYGRGRITYIIDTYGVRSFHTDKRYFSATYLTQSNAFGLHSFIIAAAVVIHPAVIQRCSKSFLLSNIKLPSLPFHTLNERAPNE